MSRVIRVAGGDPGFVNFGLASATIDLDSSVIDVDIIDIIVTEPSKNKSVLSSADSVRRIQEVHNGYTKFIEPCHVVFIEMPSTGAKDANSLRALSYALAIASCTKKPIVQLKPAEVKEHAFGKGASKDEMVEWATDLYPNLKWPKGRKYCGKYSSKAEHMADAIGAIHAGVASSQFLLSLSMMKV